MNMIVADGVSFQYEYPDEPPLKVLEHIDPVSYTHLDVYKRQVWRSWSRMTAISC